MLDKFLNKAYGFIFILCAISIVISVYRIATALPGFIEKINAQQKQEVKPVVKPECIQCGAKCFKQEDISNIQYTVSTEGSTSCTMTLYLDGDKQINPIKVEKVKK